MQSEEIPASRPGTSSVALPADAMVLHAATVTSSVTALTVIGDCGIGRQIGALTVKDEGRGTLVRKGDRLLMLCWVFQRHRSVQAETLCAPAPASAPAGMVN